MAKPKTAFWPYRDEKGRIIRVCKGLDGTTYGAMRVTATGSHERVRSKKLPMMASRDQAQLALDAYALEKGWPHACQTCGGTVVGERNTDRHWIAPGLCSVCQDKMLTHATDQTMLAEFAEPLVTKLRAIVEGVEDGSLTEIGSVALLLTEITECLFVMPKDALIGAARARVNSLEQAGGK